jgi:dihydroxyacid dehydratase/phosphogluconate dehydratase
MDARTNIDRRLPGRGVTEGLARAALATPAGAALLQSTTELLDIGEIFKKTPCAPGLKPGGRYVAKDMDEVGAIPLLMKTLFDHGHADRDCMPVAGQTTAEDLKSVKPFTANCGGVGKGTPAPEGAVVKVAGMLQDSDIIEIDADGETLDVKLSDADLADHETKWRPRATNHTSGALWTFAQQIGPAVDGAVTHPGGAHEKQCYADI